jgi:hypothetical protein
MKKALILSLLLSIGWITSCDKERMDGKTKTDEVLAENLRKSPESIIIGGNKLILDTYLWRDFQPISPPDGKMLICINFLTDVGSKPLPGNIKLLRQHIINENEIWTADYFEVRSPQEHILEGVVRNGPKWGPGIKVDVVCEFEYAGKTHRILAKEQMINRTD